MASKPWVRQNMYDEANAATDNDTAHEQESSKEEWKQQDKSTSRPLTKRLQACVPDRG